MSGMIFVYAQSKFGRSEPVAEVYFLQVAVPVDFFSRFAIQAHRIRSPTPCKVNRVKK